MLLPLGGQSCINVRFTRTVGYRRLNAFPISKLKIRYAMKKLMSKLLSTFKSCEIERPQDVKGGNNEGEEDPGSNGIIGADDIID